MKQKIITVDQYISSFPEDVQIILEKIRMILRTHAPEAIEKIAYQMPAYYLGKPLLYYGAYERHIGLYAMPSANTAFKEKLKQYKQGKGSIQFQLNEPIPYELITNIVKYRVIENCIV